jgi:hypothetical protein
MVRLGQQYASLYLHYKEASMCNGTRIDSGEANLVVLFLQYGVVYYGIDSTEPDCNGAFLIYLSW